MIRDGQLSIFLSEDAMRAWATFKPPATGGRPLELSDIESIIDAEGITHGLDWERIRESLYLCNNEHKTVSQVLIARGIESRPELPETPVFSPGIQSQSRIFRQVDSRGRYHPPGEEQSEALHEKDLEETGGRVDHRERNSIHVIHEGQVLAKLLPRRPGEFGTNVKGEQIPFATIEIKQLKPGLNVEKRENSFISMAAGRLVWDKEQFGVDTNIEISGEVGYATGNIRFPGNVLLKGEIQDGFRIWSGGDIRSKATIDAFEIFCKGDLLCSEGILGRNHGVIRVKGNLEAKFIENCRADVFGTIRIKNAILNSRVNSNSEIQCTKGKIIGGQIRFARVLKAEILGNRAGVRTVVIGGVNFVEVRKLEHCQKHLAELSGRHQEISSRFQRDRDSKHQKALAVLEKEISRMQDEIGALMETTQPDPEAVLEVQGTVFAGCVIRFGRLELTVSEDLTKKRFRPDADSGKVLVEDL